MKVVCCECKVQYGTKPGPEDKVSHGYCPTCFAAAMRDVAAINFPATAGHTAGSAGAGMRDDSPNAIGVNDRIAPRTAGTLTAIAGQNKETREVS